MREQKVMVEIRAGTGGGEANLWAGDLVNMYRRFAVFKMRLLKFTRERRSFSAGDRELASANDGGERRGRGGV